MHLNILPEEYFIELCALLKLDSHTKFNAELKPIILEYDLPYPTSPGQQFGSDIWAKITSGKDSTDSRVSYKHAKEIAKALNIQSQRDWTSFVKNIASKNKLPFPHNAASYYGSRKEWSTWTEFLGSNNLSSKAMHEELISYKAARKLMRKLDITSASLYREFVTSPFRPAQIPSNPDKFYTDWISWTDFLAPKYVDYRNAQKLVAKNKITTRKQYQDNRPAKLPSAPQTYYYEDWESWPSFLGTLDFRSVKAS